jgi:hypothetical protein
MTLFVYLYFIHFLADYTFQWSSLVKYKSDHFLGILLHSTIHLVAHFIILAPFLYDKKVWVAIAIIYLAHIGLDQSKMELNKADPKHIRLFYFIDQLIHLAVITVGAWFVGRTEPHYLSGWALDLYTNQSVALYLLILTLSTYFFDVSRYFCRMRTGKEEYKRDYKTMLINAGIVTVAFGVYWIAY